MTVPGSRDLPLVFLGICERGGTVRLGHPYLWHHNILGLRDVVIVPYLPTSLSTWSLVFAVRPDPGIRDVSIRVLDEGGGQRHLWVLHDVKATPMMTIDEPTTDHVELMTDSIPWGWRVILLPLSDILISRTGLHQVVCHTAVDSSPTPVGGFRVVQLDPPPLTHLHSDSDGVD